MNKSVKTTELFECNTPYLKELFDAAEYPWQMLSEIEKTIEKAGKSSEFSEIAPGIFVGQNVKISESATLIPPLLIGDNTEIRPSAYLRGRVIIGKDCVIGNATEVKNAILLDEVDVPHYNYVGDSVLGNRAHMGAGAVCSNIKSDKKNVTVHAESDYPTGLRKLGAMLGDGVEIGCGCVLNPGAVVGRNTSVYPLISLRGVYPENCIVKSQTDITERR